MFFDIEAIVDSLTKEDIIKILLDLGSKDYRRDGKALVFQTICHGGNKYKLYYYHEATDKYKEKIFHCYTNCSDSFNIFELVIRAHRASGVNITFYQAVRYIASMTGSMFYEDSKTKELKQSRIDDWSWINRLKNVGQGKVIESSDNEVLNEHILELFQDYYHESWLNQGITKDVMSYFGIKYWTKTNQIIIPHRNIHGELIGVRGRCLEDWDLEEGRKYVPVIVEGKFLRHSLNDTFYGLYENQAKIKQCKKAILYEGEKSVLLNRIYFGVNDFSLAKCGSGRLSIQQIKILIYDLKIKELIIASDKEFEDPSSFKAQVYYAKLVKNVQDILPYCDVNILWDNSGLLKYQDSPIDRGKDVLLELLENKQPVNEETLTIMKEFEGK